LEDGKGRRKSKINKYGRGNNNIRNRKREHRVK
jgi:hypothetical protein